jgi:hypothetical protein
MLINTSIDSNAIILITSDRLDDGGQTNRIHQDLEAITNNNDLNYIYMSVNSKQMLLTFLNSLQDNVEFDGLKPIIHFHMHGSKELGLEIGSTGEFVSWLELSKSLRKLNILLKNNLCIISTACHAYHMISEISISKATPYTCLIASQEEITFGYIDDNIIRFYNELFLKNSLSDAYDILKESLNYYHSEKVLAIALAKYIIKSCKGKGRSERQENLLTSALVGKPINITLNEVRKIIKNYIAPDENLLNRYIDIFLIGKSPEYEIKDILHLVSEYYLN